MSANNKHHADLVRMLDVDLRDKLTPEERERIYELCTGAMSNASRSSWHGHAPKPVTPSDTTVRETTSPEIPWGGIIIVILLLSLSVVL